jgi:HSP20 family protein
MSTLTPTKNRKSNGNGSTLPSIFDDFFNDRFFGPGLMNFGSPFLSGSNQIPSANIQETNNEYIVELSVPGLKREDFKVDIEDNVLTVSSETREEKKSEEKNYKRKEFSYSSFTRSFSLPENVAEEKINAKYTDGVLEITIPKKK